MALRQRTVTGTVVKANGAPLNGGTLTFTLTETVSFTSTHIIPNTAVTTTTGVDGAFSISLWCDDDDLAESGVDYTVKFPIVDGGASDANHTGTFSLPYSVSSANLGDLLAAAAVGGDGASFDPWTAWTSTITAGSGTLTSASGAGRYKQIGKSVFFVLQISITTNGTAATSILATLPFSSANTGITQMAVGRENGVTGVTVVGAILPASATMRIGKYDDTYPGGTGYVINVSGVYEAA